MFIVTSQCDIFLFDTSLCGQAGFRAWCYLRSYASLCKNTMYRNEARALYVLCEACTCRPTLASLPATYPNERALHFRVVRSDVTQKVFAVML